MHHVGTDIIEVHRIREAMERWGERFLDRVYTDYERALCKQMPERLASRFAGKEAVMKALGTGARGLKWKEIEIASESSGKPVVRLYGKAKEKAENLGIRELAVSLSDTSENAIAFVIGESD